MNRSLLPFFRGFITSLLFLIMICPPAWSDFYKWVDDEGVVHFSDQPPVDTKSTAQVESMPSAPPSKWQPPKKKKSDPYDLAPKNKTSPAKEERVASGEVELYVTSWCKYCNKAKAFLRTNKVPFRAYDIEKDSQAAKRREKLDKRSGVPLAVINGEVIIGFSEARYKKALKIE